jgi:hypothetical protein
MAGMLRRLLEFLAMALFCVTVAAGMAYTAVQQALRLTANDPQVQLAEDVANALDAGVAPRDLVQSYKIDPSVSLSAFVVIYDGQHRVLASSGTLFGKDPMPPRGVFDYVDTRGEDRVTWMPRSGIRIALVMTAYKDGYVMSGRSLRDVDYNLSAVTRLLMLLWLLCVALASMVILGVWMEHRRRFHRREHQVPDDMDRTRIR